MRRYILLIWIILGAFSQKSYAQYPQFFGYNSENGLPSNEVYSIIQDDKGFIWIGSEAGLYMFDGIRYHAYRSYDQKSRPVTGLNISSSGRLYCYNFQNQIFYIEDDKMVSLPCPYTGIKNMISNNSGQILVSHQEGVGVYNESKKKWTNYTRSKKNSVKRTTQSIQMNSKGEIGFLTPEGIGVYANGKIKYYKNTISDIDLTTGFTLNWYQDELWVFPVFSQQEVFRFKQGRFYRVQSKKLQAILQNNQVTNVKQLSDGYLWICTFNGVFRYNPANDSLLTLFSDKIFSNCIIDREGIYWFTSLQYGIIKVPDLNHIVWNDFKNYHLSKLETDGERIFIAAVDGHLGILDAENQEIKVLNTGNRADVQAFNYIDEDDKLYLYTYKNLYTIYQDKLSNIGFFGIATKHIQKYDGSYFLCSSSGIYLFDDLQNFQKIPIFDVWSQESTYDIKRKIVWVATDIGIVGFEKQKGQWRLSHKIMKDKQFLSISFDQEKRLLYALRFDGVLFSIDQDHDPKVVAVLPQEIQAYKIRIYKEKIYIGTSQGIYEVKVQDTGQSKLSRFKELSSKNIQDIIVVDNKLWVASGSSLHKIPIKDKAPQAQALVYLKNKFPDYRNIHMKSQDDPLVLYPLASTYSSEEDFTYAYRVNTNEWINLPSSTSKIEIHNLPLRNFTVDLKVIDYLGHDSKNMIHLAGYTEPLFWQTWWFYLILVSLFMILIFFVTHKVVQNIRVKELKKTEILQIQLKTIRSQMNPHFMYNALNSIQDLILQRDIKNTNYYLSLFSQLMRQILTFSEQESVLLSEELEMLQNYLKLEKLRFGEDFKYQILIDGDIDQMYIPSLLVQPLAENAIKHGLLHKKEEKELILSFSRQEGKLIIVVEDNGIGRRRSEIIRKKSKLLHKSFAGNAVQNRINLLNKIGKSKVSIQIEDVYPELEDTGTRVIIEIEEIIS